MAFSSADDFRKVIREYAIKSKRGVWFARNEKHSVRVKCQGKCQWLVFVSGIQDFESVTIKIINAEHTCGRDFSGPYVKSGWLAEKFLSKWEAKLDWKFSGFSKEVRDATGADVSKWQYYRARKRALDKFRGTTGS